MAISKTEVSTSIRPEIPSWVDSETREEILEEVGRYVASEVALHVGEGKSPVSGHGSFKKLTSDYAKDEKGGDRNPNLELEGDMLSALEWRVEMNEVKVGFFDKGQAIKAYGHNTGMKGHPWLEGVTPVRRIIPEGKESFQESIQDGVELIVQRLVSGAEEERERESDEATGTTGRRVTNNRSEPSRTQEVVDWLFGTDRDTDDWWF